LTIGQSLKQTAMVGEVLRWPMDGDSGVVDLGAQEQ